MTQPDPDNLLELAERLTPAQQKAVMILSDQWVSRMMPERMTWLDPSILEITAPLRTGHERVRLTPLGLALRNHLYARARSSNDQGRGK